MRIGILTHYYESVNYGGNLQAYALCKVLQELGHDARQICIPMAEDCQNLFTSSPNRWVKKLKKCVKATIKGVKYALLPGYRRCRKGEIARQQRLQKVFSSFNRELIPHSDRVYTDFTIRKALPEYDMFITGSDQVWNPEWYFPPFFLDFVPSHMPKLAYAASIGHTQLSRRVKAVYREHLKDFIGVSLREQDAVCLLSRVAPGAQWVLDPTLLLSREQWMQVAKPPKQEEPYVFCYFLGDDPQERRVAVQYAAARGLQLVTIPNATGIFHSNDKDFGDVRLEDPSVEAFLGLIGEARFVFTDSFHATVFSLLLGRQFAVFPRQGQEQMGSRVRDLLDTFGCPERFCSGEETATTDYVHALKDLDYTKTPTAFAEAKKRSLDFLEENLRKAEEMIV